MNKEPSSRIPERYSVTLRRDQSERVHCLLCGEFLEGNHVSPTLVYTDNVFLSKFIYPFLMKIFFRSSTRK